MGTQDDEPHVTAALARLRAEHDRQHHPDLLHEASMALGRELTDADIERARKALAREFLGGDAIVRPIPMDQPGEHIMQYFAYDHLPLILQRISRPFGELANAILGRENPPGYLMAFDPIPRNPERSAGLRKLLEAKDCIVRAALSK